MKHYANQHITPPLLRLGNHAHSRKFSINSKRIYLLLRTHYREFDDPP